MARSPDYYMIDYEPCRSKGRTNPKHNFENGSKTLNYLKMGFLDDTPENYERKQSFCLQVVTWLIEKVKSLGPEGSVVITIAPSHEANPNPTGFMHDIVGMLLAAGFAVDGRQQLIRTKDIPKHSQGPHRGTIGLKGSPDNTGKTVIILDDIWMSGCTPRVCKEVIERLTNPLQVKLFAIGKTVPNLCDNVRVCPYVCPYVRRK